MEITFATRDIGKGGAGVYSVGIIKKMIEDSSIKKINLIAPENPFSSNKINFIKIPITGKTFIIDEPLFFFFSYFLIKKNKLENTIILTQHNIFGSFKRIITVFHATSHGFIEAYNQVNSLQGGIMKLFKTVYGLFDRYSIKNSYQVVFVSQKSMETTGNRYHQYAKKFLHIPNFINTDLFTKIIEQEKIENFCTKKGITQKTTKLGYVGRIEPLKGVVELCDKISRDQAEIKNILGDFEFIVAGSGIDEQALRKYDFVKLIGKVKHEEIPYFFNSIDLFIFPSLYENFPTVILEAMSCGCFILANNVGDLEYFLPFSESQILNNKNLVTQIKKRNQLSVSELDKIKSNNITIASRYNTDRIYMQLKGLISGNI